MVSTLSRPSETGAGTRLLLNTKYEGPWERLASWLWKLHKADADGNHAPEHYVADGSVRDRLAIWAERRDRDWREGHVLKGTSPSQRWERTS